MVPHANSDKRPEPNKPEREKRPVDKGIAEDLRREPYEIGGSGPSAPLWRRILNYLLGTAGIWIAHKFELIAALWASVPPSVRQVILDFLSLIIRLF
jgi:hypothetical protein